MKRNIEYDMSKLKGRIIEKFDKRKNFATEMGWRESTLTAKLGGKTLWSQDDISVACKLLDIDRTEIYKYFFNVKAQL